MHRGRIQSQGGGIEDSEAWNQDSPILAVDGINKTDMLESRHSRREKNLRQDSFNRAKNRIVNACENGGVSHPFSKTFMVKNDRNRRVDIEVIKGDAFVKNQQGLCRP